jgi:hypothetical protein
VQYCSLSAVKLNDRQGINLHGVVDTRIFSMTDRTRQKDVQVSSVHTGAICNEIGERLRTTATGRLAPIPPELLRLVERLDEEDFPSRSHSSSH